MTTTSYETCLIYLQADASRAQITSTFAAALRAPARGPVVLAGPIGVNVGINHDARRGSEDFVHFPYKIELAPDPSATDAVVLSTAASVLEAAWGRGWRAVAACDFEADLPRRGGYPQEKGLA